MARAAEFHEQLTAHDFEALLGSSFELVADERSFPVVLVWVRPGAEPPAGSRRRRPFTLGFRAAPEVSLPQRIYGLVRPGLGRLDLFLVPVRDEGGGRVYEAVFG